MFYFVHCNKCDLKNINGACFYTCSLIALSISKKYFWPAKTRKNPKLLEMHTCLWPGAQMCFRQKWRKLATPSLLLHCIDGYSCLRYWNEIFSRLFQVFQIEVCSSALWRKRLQLGSKSDLTTTGFFVEYYIRICLVSSTSYLNGLKYGRDAHLIYCFNDIKFFRCLVWDVFWSVLQKCFYLFAKRFCGIVW